MYQAGAVAVILGGRLDPKGFMDWGARLDRAMERSKKPVEALLAARDEGSGPIKRFVDAMLGARDTAVELQTTVQETSAGIGKAMAKAAGVTDESAANISGSLKRTGASAVLTGDSFKEMADVVDRSSARSAEGVIRFAQENTAAADKIIRKNEEVAASSKAATSEVRKSYAGPVGAGGGGGGRDTAIASAGGNAEEAGKKAGASFEKGFNRMANIGKWTTFLGLGVGIVSVKFAADFQRQMELISTQVGYTQKHVDTFRKSVLDLAPAVGVGPTELSKGLYHITSVLQGQGGTNEAMKILKIAAEGAKVGIANMEDVSSALMAIYKSGPRDIHSVTEAMGVMNDIVGQGNLRMEDLSKALSTGLLAAMKNAGLGLRDIGAALDTMTSRGVPAEQASTRLRTTLTLMAAPTGKAQKALAELGISHDQLAKDMHRHGLVAALQDLQEHLDKTFPPHGRKLTVDQEREAITKYGEQLQAAGVHGKALYTDLAVFKKNLDETGSSAIQQSQLITSAFGGSRMGTTMALLMQNADDVRRRFDNLNKAGAAQRFQQDWKVTQKDFSVQASQMWAGIQKLGIIIGDWLIPKVKALVTGLMDAAKWLGHHKAAAQALAIMFGTVLVAALAAFIARLAKGIGSGIKDIADFSKAISRWASGSKEETNAVARGFDWLKKKIFGVREEIQSLNNTNVDVTTEGPGGAAGAAGEMGGMVEGMITGIRGVLAPGSAENPLAVVVMGGGGVPGMGGPGGMGPGARTAAAEERVAASELEATRGGIILPRGVSAAAPTAERALAAEAGGAAGIGGEAVTLAEGAGGVGILSKAGSVLGKVGGAARGIMGAAGEAFLPGMIGMGVGSVAQGALGLRGGGLATTGGAVVGGMLGLIGGPIGAGIGSAIGAAIGPTLVHVLGGILGTNSVDLGKKAAAGMTKGFGGESAQQLKDAVSKLIDAGAQAATGDVKAADYAKAGQLVAQQLEAGWNQYKFQDEPTMFKQFRAEVKKLPPFAQGAAAESAIKFAQELEKEGRLPKGSAAKMLKQIEAEFPGFTAYMRLTAHASMKEFNKALDFEQTKKNVKDALGRISSDFPAVERAVSKASGTIVDKSAAAVKALQDIAKHGSGPAKTQAIADIHALQAANQKSLASMASYTETTMASLEKSIDKHSGQATASAVSNFQNLQESIYTAMNNGLLSAEEGTKLLTQALNSALKAFGGNRVPENIELQTIAHPKPYQVKSYSNYVRAIQAASTHQHGGMLPGREFGMGDVMTLIDPHGNPRARMAGDEAIFNRHQMPYVEMGLQALGFHGGAQELWHKVNTPHGVGYERGGELPGFAAGGYVYPFVGGTAIGRSDQGVDASMPVGSPIGPMGDARITGVIPNWYQGQPYIWWKLLSGPRAGRYAYVSEQITNLARPGQFVHANEAVAQFAASGTGIEYGWATSSGQTLARATTGYTEGEVTPAGSDMRQFLTGLAHGKILGGGVLAGVAGPVWKALTAPGVSGKGAVHDIVKQGLNKLVSAANVYGENQAMAMGGTGAIPGNVVGNILQIAHAAQKAMGVPIDDPVLRVLLSKESGGGKNLPPTYYGGNLDPAGPFQIISGTFASNAAPGHHNRMNPYDNALAAFHYIRDRYGTLAGLAAKTGLLGPGYHGYAQGGYLPGFAAGGSPWAPLPSYTTTIPGFRPPRVRRGRSGLHTVGGGTRRGSTVTGSAGSGSKKSGSRGSVKGTARRRQPISQNTDTVLKALGLGSFADDQNLLGKLDQQYTTQENLFNMFDGGSGSLPKTDLNVLMGIREEEWDILYDEWKKLPFVVDALSSSVSTIQGHPAVSGHAGGHTTHTHGRHSGTLTVATDAPAGKNLPATGMYATKKNIADTEAVITGLEQENRNVSRAVATVHHNISAKAQQIADNYANAQAGYLDNLNAITDQKNAIAEQKNGLRQQEAALASTGSTGTIPLSTIVGQVMSGITQAPPASSNPQAQQKHKLSQQRAALNSQDTKLSIASSQIHKRLRALGRQRAADARALRAEGFDEAWQLSVKKWGIEDKITRLKAKLARLKKLLAEEDKQYKSESSALTQVNDWLTGGLQGNEAVINSLGDMGMNILGLWQQGADLPAPVPKYSWRNPPPTVGLIKSILSAAPPKGLGLTLPAGLTQAVAGAAQAGAAYADFQAFQQQRQAILSQFGSNFVAAGANPFAGTAGVAAGVQYYGAASGDAAGPGAPSGGLAGGGWLGGMGRRYGSHMGRSGPGGVTYHFENHFAAGPPDPHTWSSGLAHEIQAAT